MKKEISFWKTQWHPILWGIIFLVLGFVYFFRLAFIDPTEIATVEIVRLAFLAVFDFMLVTLYVLLALIDYNVLKVGQLEKRIDILENCAITDIEEESPRYYVVKRKLGPDKED
jgi:hypothetical protein